jgi:hypothetical protein
MPQENMADKGESRSQTDSIREKMGLLGSKSKSGIHYQVNHEAALANAEILWKRIAT